MRFYKRSAGAVVYIIEKGEVLYLLLHGRLGWDFPHGLVRRRESDEEAALREILEETNLTVEIVPSFREEIRYKYSKRGRVLYREIVYFLAKSKSKEVRLSKEHDAYTWARKTDALRLINRDETREVLIKAWKKIVEFEKVLAN
ncbi:MAG: NUDIX domain-containing protein [Pyrobaculum sp.]